MRVRQKLHMTQRELGKLLSVQDTAISAYENGDSYPSIDSLVMLSEIGRVSVEWLIMGTDDKTPLDKILTPDELRLLYNYRKAPEPLRKKIDKIVEVMSEEDSTKPE